MPEDLPGVGPEGEQNQTNWDWLKQRAFAPGDIKIGAYSNADPGWLKCDGLIYERDSYPALFAKIGTTFNTGGETATQFRVPNIVGRVPVGGSGGGGVLPSNNNLGNTGGVAAPTMPSHNHGGITAGGTTPDHLHTPVINNFVYYDGASGDLWCAVVGAFGGHGFRIYGSTGASDRSLAHDHLISSQSVGDVNIGNMPPYLVLTYFIKT